MPLDFVSTQTDMFINQDREIELQASILSPNVSFDYYRISDLKLLSHTDPKEEGFHSGFLIVDSQ